MWFYFKLYTKISYNTEHYCGSILSHTQKSNNKSRAVINYRGSILSHRK